MFTPLLEKSIFFGHQSVGSNIIAGIKDLTDSHDNLCVNINIVDLETATGSSRAGLYHSLIGKNTLPVSKLDDIVKRFDSGQLRHYDIIIFKLCYVDVTAATDIEALLGEYKKAVEYLEQRISNTRLCHITVPLRGTPKIIEENIKRAFKGPPNYYADNAARMRFNEMLVNELGLNGKVFDLAGAESQYEDGTRFTRVFQHKPIQCLVPQYTYDGGHLNNRGRTWVAEQFLRYLSKI